MDQDAFRKLISVPKQNGSQRSPAGRASIVPPKAKDDQKKSAEGSKASFKPRKLKKQSDSNYRDRAAERRIGAAGDFAEVESVLETFEKQHADDEDKKAVEEQRRYLGGDADHSVLVKGLDFALLEQTKARLAASTSMDDDEELEQAFRGVVAGSQPPPPTSLPSTTAPKRRTREELLAELKNKRAKSGTPVPAEDKAIEEAKKEGKFKPIGFKPVTASKPREKDAKVVKKKKKKAVEGGAHGVPSSSSAQPSEQLAKENGNVQPASTQTSEPKSPQKPASEPEPESINEDFDIFADAGDYEGVNFDDDDADASDPDAPQRGDQDSKSPTETATEPSQAQTHETLEPTEPRPKRIWIETEEEPISPLPHERPFPSRSDSKGKGREADNSPDPGSRSPVEPISNRDREREREEEQERERITRLAPLASSAVPSIRDILAADEALEAERKRKERKEKKKKGGAPGGAGPGGAGGGEKKASKEAKLNRDYQKLKSYTEKKGNGS